MRKAEVVIFDDNSSRRGRLEKILRDNNRQFKVASYNFAGFREKDSEEMPFPEANIYFVACSGVYENDKKRIRIAEEASRQGKVVLIAPRASLSSHFLTEAFNREIISRFLDETQAAMPKDVNRIVNSLADKIPNKETIGLIGLGNLGLGLLRELLKNHQLRIVAQSNYLKGNYSRLKEWLEHDVARVDFVNERKEVIERNPFALVIAVGRQDKSIDIEGEYENPRFAYWGSSLGACESIFPNLKNYKGLVFLESNPPGPLCLYLHRKYNHNPRKISGFTANTERARVKLASELRGCTLEDVYLSASIDKDELQVPVFGEHGKEIPDFKRALFRGEFLRDGSAWDKNSFTGSRHLEEVCSGLLAPEYRDEPFQGLFEKIGKEALLASREISLSYHEGTIKAIARSIGELANRKKFLSDSVYCYFPIQELAELGEECGFKEKDKFKHGAYLLSPARVDYENMRIQQDPFCLIKGADSDFKYRIMNQAGEQYGLVQETIRREIASNVKAIVDVG